MKFNLYVTKDVVAGEATSGISQYNNDAVAKRAWGSAIEQIVNSGNKDKIPVKDLQLFKIAEYDTVTLDVTPCNEYICSGAEFIATVHKTPNNQEKE